MNDEEFDQLKAELRKKNSIVVQQVRRAGRVPRVLPALRDGWGLKSSGSSITCALHHCGAACEHHANGRLCLCCPQGPRCSIRSRKLYSDATPDYVKMTLLNLPAALVVRMLPVPTITHSLIEISRFLPIMHALAFSA